MANIMQVRKPFRRFQIPKFEETVKALEVRVDLGNIAYLEEAK